MANKNPFDRFFDAVEGAMDQASVLGKIGSPEEEEARTFKKLNVHMKLSTAGRWHVFLRDEGGEAICGGEFDTLDDVKLPAKEIVKVCTDCLHRMGLG